MLYKLSQCLNFNRLTKWSLKNWVPFWMSLTTIWYDKKAWQITDRKSMGSVWECPMTTRVMSLCLGLMSWVNVMGKCCQVATTSRAAVMINWSVLLLLQVFYVTGQLSIYGFCLGHKSTASPFLVQLSSKLGRLLDCIMELWREYFISLSEIALQRLESCFIACGDAVKECYKHSTNWFENVQKTSCIEILFGFYNYKISS